MIFTFHFGEEAKKSIQRMLLFSRIVDGRK